MAISVSGSALAGGNPTTSFSITLPATQADDVIVLEYVHRGTTDGTIGGTYTGPAFAEKHDQQFASSAFSGKTLWSRATGDHVGETVTGASLTNSCAAYVVVYRGVDTGVDPLGDATIVGEQNASGNETQAQITTNTNGAFVVLVVVNSPDLAVTTQACTSPGALTARAEKLSTGGTDSSIAHASAAKATAGVTGAFTWAQTDAASGSWAYAIKPLGAVTHAATGALTGPGSTIAGTASSATTRPSSGVLAGPGAVIAGAANRTLVHATSGVLVGQGSTVTGIAARTRVHETSGALAGAGSIVAGDANREGQAAVEHVSDGALVGSGAVITGAASSATTREATGAIVGPGAVIAGSAARVGASVSHASSGALVGGGAIMSGSATHPAHPADTSQAGFDMPRDIRRLAVHHVAHGRLVGRGARISGMAQLTRTGQNPLALVMSAV